MHKRLAGLARFGAVATVVGLSLGTTASPGGPRLIAKTSSLNPAPIETCPLKLPAVPLVTSKKFAVPIEL